MLAEHLEETRDGVDSPPGQRGRSRVLAEGAHFGAYTILGLIGSGGMARVYRARHQALGHEVALKVFEQRVAPDSKAIARFFREAQLAAGIRHPHVVRAFDAGVHEGSPFLVMELLEGRDLEARLRSERVVEELALIELALPIVAALMALHQQGLVHGDLGPGNIFLVPAAPAAAGAARAPGAAGMGADTPKLLDVGISKLHHGLRLTAAARQRLMGSPLYMAPEAMSGRALTPASDQYSLGMILYECVTGVNPFLSTSLKESVRLILSGQRLPVLEQSVAPSPGLASIIERASSVAPEDRFEDLASLGRALLRLADQRTRATWEFSFQAGAPSPARTARGAPFAESSARWQAAAVILALLGWGTAGVVALRSAQGDASEQYVLLGARCADSNQSQQRALPLRAASEPALVEAPCPTDTAPVVHASSVVEHVLTPSPVPVPAPLPLPAEPEAHAVVDPSAESLPPSDVATEPVQQPPTARVTPRGTNNAPIFE